MSDGLCCARCGVTEAESDMLTYLDPELCDDGEAHEWEECS